MEMPLAGAAPASSHVQAQSRSRAIRGEALHGLREGESALALSTEPGLRRSWGGWPHDVDGHMAGDGAPPSRGLGAGLRGGAGRARWSPGTGGHAVLALGRRGDGPSSSPGTGLLGWCSRLGWRCRRCRAGGWSWLRVPRGSGRMGLDGCRWLTGGRERRLHGCLARCRWGRGRLGWCWAGDWSRHVNSGLQGVSRGRPGRDWTLQHRWWDGGLGDVPVRAWRGEPLGDSPGDGLDHVLELGWAQAGLLRDRLEVHGEALAQPSTGPQLVERVDHTNGCEGHGLQLGARLEGAGPGEPAAGPGLLSGSRLRSYPSVALGILLCCGGARRLREPRMQWHSNRRA